VRRSVIGSRSSTRRRPESLPLRAGSLESDAVREQVEIAAFTCCSFHASMACRWATLPDCLNPHGRRGLQCRRFSRKVHYNWPETGSTTLPVGGRDSRSRRNAVVLAAGSTAGNLLCMARAIGEWWRGTRLAQSSLIFLICVGQQRICSADATSQTLHATIAVADAQILNKSVRV